MNFQNMFRTAFRPLLLIAMLHVFLVLLIKLDHMFFKKYTSVSELFSILYLTIVMIVFPVYMSRRLKEETSDAKGLLFGTILGFAYCFLALHAYHIWLFDCHETEICGFDIVIYFIIVLIYLLIGVIMTLVSFIRSKPKD